MPSDEMLGIYLNDHLAGSAAGLELAEKLRDQNQATELGKLMEALRQGATWFVCKPTDGRRFGSELQQLGDHWARVSA